MNKKKPTKKETSWQSVAKWYDQYLSNDDNYIHQEILLPQLEKIFTFKKDDHLFDVGCGQGILSHHIPKHIRYTGIDTSKTLIEYAKKRASSSHHHFLQHDAMLPLKKEALFSHAAFILSLQNIENPQEALIATAQVLKPSAQLVIVLNHPCFRIPRQTSWEYDPIKKLQFRRVDRYMSSMEIPIQMRPSLGSKSPMTYSYHHSISALSKSLKHAGFHIELIDEWCSQKTSQGSRARAENRCRKEFPLFLTLICEKNS